MARDGVLILGAGAAILDDRRVNAKAERLVELASAVADAVDDRLAATLFIQASERERTDRGSEPAAAKRLSGVSTTQSSDSR